VWEYPFVYHNIKLALESQRPPDIPSILDVGSGVTMFPFALARQGCNVIAVDADPGLVRSFAKASRLVSTAPGTVNMVISDANSLPVNHASVDCICCISVLEHIQRFDSVIEEFSRVLKPGGPLLLTVDIDLNSAFGFSAEALKHLRAKLSEYFRLAAPDRTVHPRRVLTSDNSRYPLYPPATGFQKLGQAAKTTVRPLYRVVMGRRPAFNGRRWLNTTFGAVLRRM
jgi:ubiquinone/menaquinone biosynthesis C-methylase UbiE